MTVPRSLEVTRGPTVGHESFMFLFLNLGPWVRCGYNVYHAGGVLATLRAGREYDKHILLDDNLDNGTIGRTLFMD